MECNIKNISINYEIIGGGKPIIMLHGYAADHRLMSKCMEPVFSNKENYKRIYIDLPGMGKSTSAPWIDSSDTILDTVIEFIEKKFQVKIFYLQDSHMVAISQEG
jgi:pimeloyl-ACP methyl ester carboxylesterase